MTRPAAKRDSQPLGAALAKALVQPVEGCELPCCKPGKPALPFADRLAQWRSRHGLKDGEVIPPDELGEDGLPMCQACGGRRWLRLDLPVNHPDFGKLVRCQHCPDSARNLQRSQLARNARLSERQMAKTFATFKPRPGAEDALAAAEAWAAAPRGWLVIHGTPDPITGDNRLGQGKTHLACAITNALLDRMQRVSWWYAPDAVDAYQACFATNQHADFLHQLQQEPILVLDDLGAARATEAAIQQFLEPLLNYRERFALPTVITCIGDPVAIREYVSESIGRRFQDRDLTTVVAITADQYDAGVQRGRRTVVR